MEPVIAMSRFVALLLGVMLFTGASWADAALHSSASTLSTVAGTISDALGRPLAKVDVRVQTSNGAIVARMKSDNRGHFSFTAPAGVYAILAHKTGFKPATAIVSPAEKKQRVEISLEALQPLTLEMTTRQLNRQRNDLSPETGGSVYRFTSKNIEELPAGQNTSLRDVLTQAPGVTQDGFENGGFHVRGVDGQVQYRINGVMLPDLNSTVAPVFNPRFAHSIALLDGTLPAQFGYRTAGVIDIHTKSGCTNGGSEVSVYGGQRATYQPSFELGGCKNGWDYYLTGQYLQDNLGVQPPTKGPRANHDLTQQGQGFAYLSRFLNPTTRVTLMTGLAVGYFQIPTNDNLCGSSRLRVFRTIHLQP